jgi:hypothetical protein
MLRTIISHDVLLGKARVRFEHNDVTTEQNYNLIDVIPGTRYILEQMGLEFTSDDQDIVLDRLESMIQSQIELGMIVNPPEAEAGHEVGSE